LKTFVFLCFIVNEKRYRKYVQINNIIFKRKRLRRKLEEMSVSGRISGNALD